MLNIRLFAVGYKPQAAGFRLLDARVQTQGIRYAHKERAAHVRLKVSGAPWGGRQTLLSASQPFPLIGESRTAILLRDVEGAVPYNCTSAASYR